MSMPARVGRYEVVGHLATGGMAEILLARLLGLSGFERVVVVKRILPHLARTESFVGMFLDEARIVAALHHQNVVQVYELGREGGDLFLAMEYLQGESAAGLLKRLRTRNEPLGYDLAAFIVAEACAGLHAAHELKDKDEEPQHLVHRDVSPQNLFVTYAGEVKVIDFGIAKTGDRVTRTEAGQLKGKFQYMSPEQCRGAKLDRRSDIFALGNVLYELTTGRQLFKRASELQVLKAITDEPVLPPSRLLPDYPASLETICLRALARDRRERYPTAAAMRTDLLQAMGELRKDADVSASLARLMEAAFADRIAEKREMLRRVRSGSAVTHVPAGDADEAVELPGLSDEPTLGTELGSYIETAVPLAVQRGRSRARWRWALSTVGLTAAFVGAVALGARLRGVKEEAGALAPPPVAESIPAAPRAPEPLTSAPPPLPEHVVVHVESRPSRAHVLVDGSDRGPTPIDLRLLRGTSKVALELRARGFSKLTQSITPDVDQRMLLVLLPEAPRARPVGRLDAGTIAPPAGSFDKW